MTVARLSIDVVAIVFRILEAEQLQDTFTWEEDAWLHQRVWLALTKTCRQFHKLASKHRRVILLHDDAGVRSFGSYHRRYPLDGLRIKCMPDITAKGITRIQKRAGAAITHLSVPPSWIRSGKVQSILHHDIMSTYALCITPSTPKEISDPNLGMTSLFWNLAKTLQHFKYIRALQISKMRIEQLFIPYNDIHIQHIYFDGVTFLDERSAQHFGRMLKENVRNLRMCNMGVADNKLTDFLYTIGPSLESLHWDCRYKDWQRFQSPSLSRQLLFQKSTWNLRRLTLDFTSSGYGVLDHEKAGAAEFWLPSSLKSLAIKAIPPQAAKFLLMRLALQDAFLPDLLELPRLCAPSVQDYPGFQLCLGKDGREYKVLALAALRERGISMSTCELDLTLWGA